MFTLSAITFTKTKKLSSSGWVALRVISRFFYGLSSVFEDYTICSGVIRQSDVPALNVFYPGSPLHEHSELYAPVYEAFEGLGAGMQRYHPS